MALKLKTFVGPTSTKVGYYRPIVINTPVKHPRNASSMGCFAPSRPDPAAAPSWADLARNTQDGSDVELDNAPAEPTPQVASEGHTVNWTSRWWAVHDVASVDPKIPMHLDVLGKSLVVWADSKGEWHCLEDKCPHRLAPLSEGRVEGDSLMCSYHGWTFNGSGACLDIPQIMDPAAKASACASKRCGTKAYPVQVQDGLLWVWPESGPEAALKAAATEVPHMDCNGTSPWFVREVPLRWDTLVENAMDPSHVPYAHHGFQGNRYKTRSGWETFKYQKPSASGCVAETEPMGGMGRFGMQFMAPGILSYRVNGKKFGPQVLALPTKPGWSKLIVNFYLDTSLVPFPGNVIMEVLKLKNLFPVLDHCERNSVVDGDTFFLHVAERLLPPSKGIGKAAMQSYYMPSGADVPVIMFRNWVQEFGGKVPTCSPDTIMPAVMDKAQVLDRWNQHGKDCIHCRRAAANVDKLSSVSMWVGLAAGVAVVAQAVAVAALVQLQPAAVPAAASTLPAYVPPVISAWWHACQAAGLGASLVAAAGLALACAVAHKWLTNTVKPQLYYKEYVHALND